MSWIKRVKSWCPQPPQSRIRQISPKLSTSSLAAILLAEIILLLVLPMIYYAFWAPTTMLAASLEDRNLPLTKEQISSAWPNLPTAQEIVDSGKGDYSSVDSRWGTVDFAQIYNHTWLSPLNAQPRTYPSGVFVTRLVPVENFIWLQLNETTWISPGNSWLSTDNPPYSLPSTDSVSAKAVLPTEYFIIPAVAIGTTLAFGLSYLVLNGRRVRASRATLPR